MSRSGGFGYEFRRTLLRPSLLTVIAVGGLVALASGAQVASNNSGPSRMYSAGAFYYEGAYRFDFYAFNEYGASLSDVPFTVHLTGYGNNQTIYSNHTGTTDTNGTLQLSAPVPQGSYQVGISAGPPNDLSYWSNGASGGEVSIGPLAGGQVEPLLNPLVWPLTLPVGFSGQPGFELFLPPANESRPQSLMVYYALGSSVPNVGPATEANASLLGSLTSSHRFFPLVLSSPLSLLIEIFAPNGTLVASDSNWTTGFFSLGQTWQVASNSQFTSSFSNNMLLLLPLMAVVASVAVYARDRSSGVLESTLVRPITPVQLAFSRLFALVTALLLSVAVGMLIADALIHGLVGVWVLPSFLIAFAITASITIGFFVGLVLAVSHAFKSLMPVLTLGLGLYFLFDVFWNSLRLTVAGNSNAALVRIQLYNPIGYVGLAWASLTNVLPVDVYGLSANATRFGVGPWVVGPAAIGWALIPAVALLTLTLTRD